MEKLSASDLLKHFQVEMPDAGFDEAMVLRIAPNGKGGFSCSYVGFYSEGGRSETQARASLPRDFTQELRNAVPDLYAGRKRYEVDSVAGGTKYDLIFASSRKEYEDSIIVVLLNVSTESFLDGLGRHGNNWDAFVQKIETAVGSVASPDSVGESFEI
jgi:hypothetical protein